MQERSRLLTEDLKNIKAHNEELLKQKAELTQELKLAKDELAELIDKNEQHKNALMREINTLKEKERQLNETREKERKAFEETQRSYRKKIELLTESLNKKDEEINKLKSALFELNETEQKRLQDLDREAETFKKILERRE